MNLSRWFRACEKRESTFRRFLCLCCSDHQTGSAELPAGAVQAERTSSCSGPAGRPERQRGERLARAGVGGAWRWAEPLLEACLLTLRSFAALPGPASCYSRPG